MRSSKERPEEKAPGQEPESPRGMDRRAFLKLAGVVGAGLAAGVSPFEKSAAAGQSKSPEALLTPERLHEIIRVAKQRVKEQFVRELAADEISGGVDHYVLAVGQEVAQHGKTVGEIAFSKWEMSHQGAIEYSLVRAGFPLSTTLAREGRHETLEGFIHDRLKHVAVNDNMGYEYEWVTLLAVELLKRGKAAKLGIESLSREKYPHLKLTLEHMHEKNTAEWEEVFKPEALTAEERATQRRGEGIMNMGPHCEGLHALHAMAAYEAIKGNRAELGKIVAFIVTQAESRLNKKSPDDLHFLGHLLTPLGELPADYQFTAREKQVLKSAIAHLATELAVADPKGQIPSIAHVIDALTHLPPELRP